MNEQKFVLIVFVELCTAHRLKKKSRLYNLSDLRYLQNTRCCNHYAASGTYTSKYTYAISIYPIGVVTRGINNDNRTDIIITI